MPRNRMQLKVKTFERWFQETDCTWLTVVRYCSFVIRVTHTKLLTLLVLLLPQPCLRLAGTNVKGCFPEATA